MVTTVLIQEFAHLMVLVLHQTLALASLVLVVHTVNYTLATVLLKTMQLFAQAMVFALVVILVFVALNSMVNIVILQTSVAFVQFPSLHQLSPLSEVQIFPWFQMLFSLHFATVFWIRLN